MLVTGAGHRDIKEWDEGCWVLVMGMGWDGIGAGHGNGMEWDWRCWVLVMERSWGDDGCWSQGWDPRDLWDGLGTDGCQQWVTGIYGKEAADSSFDPHPQPGDTGTSNPPRVELQPLSHTLNQHLNPPGPPARDVSGFAPPRRIPASPASPRPFPRSLIGFN